MRRGHETAAGREAAEEAGLEAKRRWWLSSRSPRDGELRQTSKGSGGARLGLRSPGSPLHGAAAAPATVSGERAAGDGGGGGGGREGYAPEVPVFRVHPSRLSCSPPVNSLPSTSSPSPSPSPSSAPSGSSLHEGYRRRRRRRGWAFSAAGITPAAAAAAAAAAAVPIAAAGTEASTVGAAVVAGQADGADPRRVQEHQQRLLLASASSATDKDGAALDRASLLGRLRRRAAPSSSSSDGGGGVRSGSGSDAAAEARETGGLLARPGLAELVRSFSSGTRRRGVLEDLLKVVVWSFFAERLLQSALVGWGLSGRVGPVEQLGGTVIEANPSDPRYVETRAVLRGIRMGRDTVHLNTARTSPEMFTKVDISEIRHPSSTTTRDESRPKVERGDDDGDAEALDQGAADAEEGGDRSPLVFHEYAAPAFAHLRGLYGMSSSEYRRSFREGSRMIAHASNSKSAQSFMFSEDGKYMLKTASESELDSMLRLLPRYAEHVARRRGSLITRFYGIYRVTDPDTKRSTVFVSSSNVFSTEKRLHERYDLKGSVVGRQTMSPKGGGVVKPTTMLKDLDLADGGKIRLAAGCKKRLLAELSADAGFLAGLGVMDYSLLVGIHRPHRPKPNKVLAFPLTVLSLASKPVWSAGCLVLGFLPGGAKRGGRRPQVGVYPGREPGVVYYMGIIDVLQRYNLKKILERGAKGVVYNRHEISAVPPEEYRDRFLDFIDSSTE